MCGQQKIKFWIEYNIHTLLRVFEAFNRKYLPVA